MKAYWRNRLDVLMGPYNMKKRKDHPTKYNVFDDHVNNIGLVWKNEMELVDNEKTEKRTESHTVDHD